MKTNEHWSIVFVSLMIAAALAAFAQSASAQAQSTLQPQSTSNTRIMLAPRADKTQAQFNANNIRDWNTLSSDCTTINDACAEAAIAEVSTQCSVGAKFFKKDTKKWQWINFALIMTSAAFTAVGASTTIANAKVYSTLGGTTGLGAVTTTINANTAGDQAGLTAVNTILQNFLKYVQTGGPNNGAPDDAAIFKAAPIYAAQCSAAANATSGTSQK